MEGKTAEKVTPAIGPLVLALAKTFHWAGLYGTNHPILAQRVPPEGLLSLFRYLHESQGYETAVSPEQFLRESGITGTSLSPYNYKELLSRKLSDSHAPVQSESREQELWRLLLTDDFPNKNVEENMM